MSASGEPPADAVRLNYRDAGNGAPLLFLHGLFGSSTNWRGFARRFEGEYRTIAADMRNHGSSPWSDTMNYPAMAADIKRLADDLDLPSCTILGHSMGGKAAMACALLFPEVVGRLIVVDIAPVTYEHSHLALIDAMMAIDPAAIGSRTDADAMLAGAEPDSALRQFLLQNLVFDDGAYRWRINLEVLADRHADLLDFPRSLDSRVFEGPALFVHGSDSGYVLAAHHQRIRQLFPAAEIATVDDAGHWVHAENPDGLFQVIDQHPGRG